MPAQPRREQDKQKKNPKSQERQNKSAQNTTNKTATKTKQLFAPKQHKKQLEHQEKSVTQGSYTHLTNFPAQTNHQLAIARWATKQDNTQTLCCPKYRCQQGKLF